VIGDAMRALAASVKKATMLCGHETSSSAPVHQPVYPSPVMTPVLPAFSRSYRMFAPMSSIPRQTSGCTSGRNGSL
jgi:hypothetical protein